MNPLIALDSPLSRRTGAGPCRRALAPVERLAAELRAQAVARGAERRRHRRTTANGHLARECCDA